MDIAKYQAISEGDYNAVAGPDWPSYPEFQLHKSVSLFVYAEIDQMLLGPAQFENTAFCVLPFFGQEIPSKTSCCLLPVPHDLDQIKNNMLLGTRPKECAKCWTLEDIGLKSDRQIKNETLGFYFDQDISALFDVCQQGKNSSVHYKIDTSNTCNSTCTTCNSMFSSLWAQLENKHGKTPHKHWSLTSTDVWSDIDFVNARSIGFRGGEPLLSVANFEILKGLIEHGNTDCFINFTTNGSVALDQKQKDILAQFKNINMCFSIDGIGPVFEYLRYPLNWNRLLKNINYCKSAGILVSANYSVSNLNILYHRQTCEWFDQNQITYLINPIYDPVWFRIGALPTTIKKQLLKDFPNTDIRAMLETDQDQDLEDFAQFRQEISKQDQWKGIRMQDYLPELYNLIG